MSLSSTWNGAQSPVYVGVVATNDDDAKDNNLRTRLGDELWKTFGETCKRKKITKQEAVESLCAFWCLQEDAVQSMMVGQIDARDDLIEIALRRIAVAKQPSRRGKGEVTTEPNPARAPRATETKPK